MEREVNCDTVPWFALRKEIYDLIDSLLLKRFGDSDGFAQ